MNLGSSINTSHNERGVGFSRDGHFMFLVSDRPGGLGGFDIWVSRRIHVNDDFGWQPPVNLGQAVNSSSNDAGPNYFQDDYSGATHLYLASNRPGGLGSYDIYVSALLVNGWFGQAVLVTELSSAQNDLRPAIRHDGLEIFLNSNRFEGIGDMDLWSADRQTVADFWSQPENLGPAVNSNSVDSFPSLSSDGQTLFFNSDRLDPDSSGGLDLYVITRSKAK